MSAMDGARADVIKALGGPIAEEIHLGWTNASCANDLRIARDAAIGAELSGVEIQKIARRVRRTLRQNWPVVARLADALRRRNALVLAEWQVARIIGFRGDDEWQAAMRWLRAYARQDRRADKKK